MRLAVPFVTLAILFGCGSASQGPAEDTIPAWEAWLEDNSDGVHAIRGIARLQDMYLDKARASGQPADYDAYLERFPDGVHVRTVKEERRKGMFRKALRSGAAADWEAYLADYPNTPDDHDDIAREGLEAARYAPHVSLSPVRTVKVNLAEDPEGPLNGTAFRTDVTNNGDRTLQAWWLRIFYLDDQGRVVGRKKWPVVETARGFPVPMPPEASVPMKPGETRTWEWATGDLPKGFSGELALVPMRVRFADDG